MTQPWVLGLDFDGEQLVREDDVAVVDGAYVAEALFHWAVPREVGPDMHESERPYSGLLGHAGRPGSAALAVRLAVSLHSLLVVPAHAEHDVRIPRKVDHGLARLGVAGEHHAALRAVDTVRQGVQVRLHVLCFGRGDLPAIA